MKVAAVVSDLILFSRIASAASDAKAQLARVDRPHDTPRDAELVLVDWSAREPDWGNVLRSWSERNPRARIVLFGPHTDLEAHAAARATGLGPMLARSKLLGDLRRLLDGST